MQIFHSCTVYHAHKYCGKVKISCCFYFQYLCGCTAAYPGNVPLIVTRTFAPSANWAAADEVMVTQGAVVNALYKHKHWVYVRTADETEGFVPFEYTLPLSLVLPKNRKTPEKLRENGGRRDNCSLPETKQKRETEHFASEKHKQEDCRENNKIYERVLQRKPTSDLVTRPLKRPSDMGSYVNVEEMKKMSIKTVDWLASYHDSLRRKGVPVVPPQGLWNPELMREDHIKQIAKLEKRLEKLEDLSECNKRSSSDKENDNDKNVENGGHHSLKYVDSKGPGLKDASKAPVRERPPPRPPKPHRLQSRENLQETNWGGCKRQLNEVDIILSSMNMSQRDAHYMSCDSIFQRRPDFHFNNQHNAINHVASLHDVISGTLTLASAEDPPPGWEDHGMKASEHRTMFIVDGNDDSRSHSKQSSLTSDLGESITDVPTKMEGDDSRASYITNAKVDSVLKQQMALKATPAIQLVRSANRQSQTPEPKMFSQIVREKNIANYASNSLPRPSKVPESQNTKCSARRLEFGDFDSKSDSHPMKNNTCVSSPPPLPPKTSPKNKLEELGPSRNVLQSAENFAECSPENLLKRIEKPVSQSFKENVNKLSFSDDTKAQSFRKEPSAKLLQEKKQHCQTITTGCQKSSKDIFRKQSEEQSKKLPLYLQLDVDWDPRSQRDTCLNKKSNLQRVSSYDAHLNSINSKPLNRDKHQLSKLSHRDYGSYSGNLNDVHITAINKEPSVQQPRNNTQKESGALGVATCTPNKKSARPLLRRHSDDHLTVRQTAVIQPRDVIQEEHSSDNETVNSEYWLDSNRQPFARNPLRKEIRKGSSPYKVQSHTRKEDTSICKTNDINRKEKKKSSPSKINKKLVPDVISFGNEKFSKTSQDKKSAKTDKRGNEKSPFPVSSEIKIDHLNFNKKPLSQINQIVEKDSLQDSNVIGTKLEHSHRSHRVHSEVKCIENEHGHYSCRSGSYPRDNIADLSSPRNVGLSPCHPTASQHQIGLREQENIRRVQNQLNGFNATTPQTAHTSNRRCKNKKCEDSPSCQSISSALMSMSSKPRKDSPYPSPTAVPIQYDDARDDVLGVDVDSPRSDEDTASPFNSSSSTVRRVGGDTDTPSPFRSTSSTARRVGGDNDTPSPVLSSSSTPRRVGGDNDTPSPFRRNGGLGRVTLHSDHSPRHAESVQKEDLNTSSLMYGSPSAVNHLQPVNMSTEEQVVPGTPNNKHSVTQNQSLIESSQNDPSSCNSQNYSAGDNKNNLPDTSKDTSSNSSGKFFMVLRSGPTMTILYDFDGLEEDDLTVKRGETVILLNDDDANWLWVRNEKGMEGYMPRDFAVENGYSECGIEVPEINSSQLSDNLNDMEQSITSCAEIGIDVPSRSNSKQSDSDVDGAPGTSKLSLSYSASSTSSLEQNDRLVSLRTSDSDNVEHSIDVSYLEDPFTAGVIVEEKAMEVPKETSFTNDDCVPFTPELNTNERGVRYDVTDLSDFEESPIDVPQQMRRETYPQRSFQMYL